MNCKHSGYFLGVDGLSCELIGKVRKRPRNYTNRKSFGSDDPPDIQTVAIGKGVRVSG